MHSMRRLLFYAAFLFFLGATVFLLVRCVGYVVARNAVPLLVCDPSSHDFGTISQGDNPEHRFLLENRGRRPVLFIGAAPGCGSCVEVLETPPQVLEPGQSYTLLLRLLSAHQAGEISKTAVLHTTDPVAPFQVLTLKATVLPP